MSHTHSSPAPAAGPNSACSVPCNLCGGTNVETVSELDRQGQPLRTVICRGCGLVYTDPRPTHEETRRFYADDYRVLYKATSTPRPKHAYRETLRALARIREIEPLLAPGTRLLDVGSGGGFFVYALNRQGVVAQGIEPNKGFAGYAAKELQVNVQNLFLQDADFPPGSFDVITLNHVLEHVEDPCATLERLRGWVRPGGAVVVEVPNVEATVHAPRNRFHVGHLYNFNAATLEGIGQRAGLSPCRTRLVTATRHLHTIFERPSAASSITPDLPGEENYHRVRDILQRHTSLVHYTSPSCYLRVVSKQWNYLREWQRTRGAGSGREIVDKLLGQARRPRGIAIASY